MAGRSSWRGAVEFGGFPINVVLYNRKKSRSAESFKTIGPDGLPVRSVYLDGDGNEVDRATTKRGVPTGRDTYFVLPDEALEAIKEGSKSVSIEPKQWCPKESIPFELAETTYFVTPDLKVPGAEKPVGILWNGLRASGLAYASDVTIRAGSRDSILVLWADDDGLYATSLPYTEELHAAPDYEFEVDDEAAEVFTQFVKAKYEVNDGFDHQLHRSEYRERREAAISAAMNGEQIDVPSAPTPASEPDLMALMQQTAKDAKRQSKGGKKKAAK